MQLRRTVATLAAGAGLLACSAANEQESFRAPSRVDFDAVSATLGVHCGSLDCHGSTTRNFRIYSENGLRLDASSVSGDGGTTLDEHDANYASVLALEPELLDRVVADQGRHPERLTLVRKARGSEAHEGDGQLPPGSDGDTCLTSWLAGAVDRSACARAAEPLPPPR